MKAGTLLRVGIYLIGVWTFFRAMTDGVYYLFEFLRASGWTLAEWSKVYFPGAVAYFFIPMGIALATAAFGGRLSRLLLGRHAQEEIPGASLAAPQMLEVGLKLLGAYAMVTFGPGVFSSGFEVFADAIHDNRETNITAMRNLIYEATGCGAGWFLCFKTRRVLDKILVEPEPPRS